MKNSIFLLICLIFFSACSIKVQTNHLPDGTVEYNDNIMGLQFTLKQKNGFCLEDAKFKDMDSEINIKLDKYCNVLSGKIYYSNGSVIDIPKDKLNILSKEIKNYVNSRQNISTDTPAIKTKNSDSKVLSFRNKSCKSNGGVPSWDFKKDQFICKGID